MHDSVVTDIFAGMTQSAVECQTCKNVTRSFEPFLDLSVAIPRAESKSLLQKTLRATGATADGGGGKATLDACLGAYTASEKLDDMFDCEKCKQKRKATKRLSIFRAPRILVVCIKRFYFQDMMHREKISTHVDFNSEGLDLTPFLTETLHGHVDVHDGARAPASKGGRVTYVFCSVCFFLLFFLCMMCLCLCHSYQSISPRLHSLTRLGV
jgi:ubiquitin C-terminal hydrolase